MILYGASGHAKVIIDICEINKEKNLRIIDDNKEVTSLLSYPVTQIEYIKITKEKFIISIGNNKTRKKIVNKLQSDFGIAIHPNTIIDKTVTIGSGTVVMAGSVINSSTKIGKHCIINTSSSIDHDCIIDDFVHISPNATLCGGVVIGEGSHIGAGAIIIPSVKIGKWSTIGAGTVVIKDVPDGKTVVGNPSRTIK
ncbi:MAG: acetyltransferase [Bacteroidetes bacterium]|nr:acetyltransferase [Bacteroidota bacterium]